MSSSDVLIVGAGCFGLSTALHLKRSGIASVTLIDRQSFPCKYSASQDSSRIVRADYPDSVYAELGQEALTGWQSDHVFKPAFHKTGWIFAALPGDPFVLDSYKLQKKLGTENVRMMESGNVVSSFAGLSGNLSNWDIYHNPTAGWANAALAMQLAMDEFLRLGGVFISGRSGTFASLLTNGSSSQVIGVETIDGTRHFSSKVVLATGSELPGMINTQTQIHPLGFCVAHWRLTPAELEVWADHPVVDLHRHGYFFPPDKSGLMKIGYGMSAYTSAAGPWTYEGIPSEAEAGMRQILRMVAPSIADKPFFATKVCWDGLTSNKNWLISQVPGHAGLFVAAGGSGHAFKFLPVMGKYVAMLLDGNLPREYQQRWQWKQGTGDASMAVGGRPVKELYHDRVTARI